MNIDLYRYKLILTPNRRLSSFLHKKYGYKQLKDNKTCWETPRILPLDAWIKEIWERYLDIHPEHSRIYLSTLQEQIIWEKVIQSSEVGENLLRVPSTAKKAMQAWQLNLAALEPYLAHSIDTQVFYQWVKAYLDWLDIHQAIDSVSVLSVIIDVIHEIEKILPKNILLLGFDEFTPQNLRLLECLQQYSIEVVREHIIQPCSNVYRMVFPNLEAELRYVAEEAKRYVHEDPAKIVAIVVPELEKQRKQVVQIMREVFKEMEVNISAPMPIAQYPMIDTALLILQLARPIVAYCDMSILLRSSFIRGGYTEISQRALLDRLLRDHAEEQVTWKFIIAQIEIVDLHTVCNNFVNKFKGLQGKQFANYWVKQIKSLLHIWGWPGDTHSETMNVHLLACWDKLLDAYYQLEDILQIHSFSQALQVLQRLALETPFLPAETGHVSVNVLGILEAAGISFDRLWITGMSRETWPPDAAPNHFIPIALQRQYDLPRSSATRELAVAKRLTKSLLMGGIDSVGFSYSRLMGDCNTEVSPLIADLPEIILKKNDIPNKLNIIQHPLEELVDHNAPRIDDSNDLCGGVKILQLQAQCAFRSFSELRLLSSPLKIPVSYLTHTERGEIVHEILALFWRNCRTQATLIKKSTVDLKQEIAGIIDKVLKKWRNKRPMILSNLYIVLEKNRLQNLILCWLQHEKTRAPFAVIQVEQKSKICIGPITISVRLDRVDKLATGEQIIIDYKTGYMQLSSWFGAEITQPQLPLYAIGDYNVQGLIIGVVRPEQIQFKGVCEVEQAVPQVPTLEKIRQPGKASDWQQQLQMWREKLHQVVNDFVNGDAKVYPKQGTISCSYCQLQNLCRIGAWQ